MEDKRSVDASHLQKRVLDELMKKHPRLRETFSVTETNSQKQWKHIAELLNAIPGPKKEWLQWRRVCML